MATFIKTPRLIINPSPRLPCSTSSSSLSSYSTKNFMYRVPSWLLVFLLFSVSLLTFFLQWHGGDIDPINQWSLQPVVSTLGCATKVLGGNSSVSSDFRSWKFYNESNVTPKVSSYFSCIIIILIKEFN